ncbi:hypothetical protein K431DRAFT_301403 [Polychaeton citri CBS 116435]|uniref:Uncharacterized protein n=1 Tax=Polychaeton citri CBS 116435 TaxID=1314669 RepID=A0A9P4URG4_9PEZI|nr:hypothetical protein K431DRAFT_301403 [Polychaeton citri CBS 116435]
MFQTPMSPNRPVLIRRPTSRDSPGWYNTAEGLTLNDFADRNKTFLKRCEKYSSDCATGVVMALLSPTPTVLLIVLNPAVLIFGMLLGLYWLTATLEGGDGLLGMGWWVLL